jgi:hypothetical protein
MDFRIDELNQGLSLGLIVTVFTGMYFLPQLPFSQSPMTFRLIIKERYGCINMEIMMVLILKLTNLTICEIKNIYNLV